MLERVYPLNKFPKDHSFVKNERGFTLVTVLVVLVVLTILATSVLVVTSNSIKMSIGERNDQSAYYIAEAGATIVMASIEEKVNTLPTQKTYSSAKSFFGDLESTILQPKTVESFEPILGEQPYAKITVKQVEPNNSTASRNYKITSNGEIGNRNRTVVGTINITFTEGTSIPSNLGVFASERMEITNGTINGNLILNPPKEDNTSPIASKVIVSGSPIINGKIFLPSSSLFEAPTWWKNSNKPIIVNNNESLKFPLPPFPSFPIYKTIGDKYVGTHRVIENGDLNVTNYLVADYKLQLDTNYQFNNITINSNRNLTFDIGNKDVSIVVNRIEGQGNIYIQGTGTLTIYVKDNIDLKGADFNTNGKDNLFIYIGPSTNPKSPKTYKKSDYGNISASIYAADANIELSGSANFTGHIVTGGSTVKIPGGTKASAKGTVVYAPFANVELLGGGRLDGAVVSKTFYIAGGASINSKDVVLNDIPFFSGSGVSGGTFKKVIVKEVSDE